MHLFQLYDWAASIWVGFWVVTYWRCAWLLLDLLTCDQPEDATLALGNTFCLLVDSTVDPDAAAKRIWSAGLSYGVGMGCLAVGVLIIWMGWWVPNNDTQKVTQLVALIRFITIYILGFSAVNVWRGIWYWADAWILPNQPYASFWTTSIAGATLCYLLWGGNSLLAPPFIFLLDGPGLASPPVAVTLLNSHNAVSVPVDKEPPQLSMAMRIIDILISFVVIPFGVVWFWRGSWLLLDYWFWGLTVSDDDIDMSLLWTSLLAVLLAFVTSEPVIGLLDSKIENRFLLLWLGRVRSYFMAWGAVAFWRLVWLIWDQFLGGSTYLSAALGHVIAILILTASGCLSSVCAPSSTLGVDTVPDENAADEPLFSMLPLPHELLHVFGIARQPSPATKEEFEIEMGHAISNNNTASDVGQRKENERMSHSDTKETVLIDASTPEPSESCTQLAEEDGEKAGVGLHPDEGDKLQQKNAESDEKYVVEDKGDLEEGKCSLEEQKQVPEKSELGKEKFNDSANPRRRSHQIERSSVQFPATPRRVSLPNERSFRNYAQLQRFGSVRIKTESAQRPSLTNQRSRSKFFRSR